MEEIIRVDIMVGIIGEDIRVGIIGEDILDYREAFLVISKVVILDTYQLFKLKQIN